MSKKTYLSLRCHCIPKLFTHTKCVLPNRSCFSQLLSYALPPLKTFCCSYLYFIKHSLFQEMCIVNTLLINEIINKLDYYNMLLGSSKISFHIINKVKFSSVENAFFISLNFKFITLSEKLSRCRVISSVVIGPSVC